MEPWEQVLLERRAGFIDKAMARLGQMRELVTSLKENYSEAQLVQLKRSFHQLAGSAGIHEMDEFCREGISGEDLCAKLQSENAGGATLDVRELELIVDRLQKLLDRAAPDSVSPTRGATNSASAKTAFSSGGAKILSVEDDPEFATFIVEALQGAGYEVRSISDAALFTEELQSFSPDLLLLDIVLGDFDGTALAQQALTNPISSDVPIVFLSTQRDVAQIPGCTYLIKPIAASVLISTISEKLRPAKQ